MSDIDDHYEGRENSMIDTYRIVRKLGTGTFGRVFLCMTTESRQQPKKRVLPKIKQSKYRMQTDREKEKRDEEALAEAEEANKHLIHESEAAV